MDKFQSRRNKKVLWSTEDDVTLIKVICRLKTLNWPDIAALVPGRSPKQCRGKSTI